MLRLLLAVFVSGAALIQAADEPKVTVTRWPQNRTAAASLTFDDAVPTHLDVAGPVLARHHLTGTFYVNTTRGPWREHIDGWRALAAAGNEIGNHTVNHPCLLDRITPHAQQYTPAMMEVEVRDAAREIAEKIGSSRGMTFGYPCGNLSFGPPRDQARNSALYLGYVADCCFAGRGYLGNAAPQNPDELNVLTVTDLGVTEGKSFSQLLAMLEPGVRSGNWGIFTFHGVGGDWLPVPDASLEELAQYLEKHQEIWTATFGDGVRYTQERRSLGIAVARSGADAFDVALDWPLDPAVFDLPLTLRIELPEQWKGATIQGAKIHATAPAFPAPASTGAKVILIDVPPQTERLTLSRAQ